LLRQLNSEREEKDIILKEKDKLSMELLSNIEKKNHQKEQENLVAELSNLKISHKRLKDQEKLKIVKIVDDLNKDNSQELEEKN